MSHIDKIKMNDRYIGKVITIKENGRHYSIFKCSLCSKEFESIVYNNKSGLRFCSRKHLRDYYNKLYNEREGLNISPIIARCSHCNKEFKTKAYNNKSGLRFCCIEHLNAYHHSHDANMKGPTRTKYRSRLKRYSNLVDKIGKHLKQHDNNRDAISNNIENKLILMSVMHSKCNICNPDNNKIGSAITQISYIDVSLENIRDFIRSLDNNDFIFTDDITLKYKEYMNTKSMMDKQYKHNNFSIDDYLNLQRYNKYNKLNKNEKDRFIHRYRDLVTEADKDDIRDDIDQYFKDEEIS